MEHPARAMAGGDFGVRHCPCAISLARDQPGRAMHRSVAFSKPRRRIRSAHRRRTALLSRAWPTNSKASSRPRSLSRRTSSSGSWLKRFACTAAAASEDPTSDRSREHEKAGACRTRTIACKSGHEPYRTGGRPPRPRARVVTTLAPRVQVATGVGLSTMRGLSRDFQRSARGHAFSFVRKTARTRLRSLLEDALPMGQAAIAAGVAWYLAHNVIGHERAFFAPIAALIALGV